MFDYDDTSWRGNDDCFEIAFQFDSDFRLRDIEVEPCDDCEWDNDWDGGLVY